MKASINSVKKKRNYFVKHKLVLCFLVLLFLFDAVWCLKGVSVAADKAKYCMPVIMEAIFSQDNDKILFRHGCGGEELSFSWAVYEMTSAKVYNCKELNNATPHALKYQPAFSRDGKLITFVSGQDDHRNIYIMNADGTNVRQLTHDYNEKPQKISERFIAMIFNEMPSFSPDGKKIIFVRSAVKRTYLKSTVERPADIRPSRWDIYEIEIATGKERRLTNYGFPHISRPFYMADGKRFIFSAKIYSANDYETVLNTDEINVYGRKYHKNLIFIMDGKNNELIPAFENGRQSEEPRVGNDDLIIFQSKLNERDKTLWSGRTVDLASSIQYAIFTYKSGKIKRLTDESTRYATLSQDGSRILLQIGWRIKIINTDGSGQNIINIPREQYIRLNKNY